MSLMPFTGRCIHCGHDHGNAVFSMYKDIPNTASGNSVSTIEQLTARVRELEEQYELAANLANTSMDRVRELEEENARLKTESRDASLGLNDYYGRKLAAEQLNNKLLRDALKMVTNKVCWSVFTDSEETQIEEALAQPSDTSALDVYMAEKVKEATATQKEYYEGVFQDGSKQIAKAFRQRDLAVEELEQRGHSAGCRKNAFGDLCTCGLDETLVAIKESEAK